MTNTYLSAAVALLAGSMLVLPLSAKTESNDLLKPYDQMVKALANDDLAGAKRAAGHLSESAKGADEQSMAEHASAVAKSDSLEAARDHLKMMSGDATALAKGNSQYHVMKCSMLGATWVQSGDKVMNPYMGKQMQQCGSMVKGKEGAGMEGMNGMEGPAGMSCCGRNG